MKLFLGKKVGVSKEERALPYFKFFEQPMAEIPNEKIKLIDEPSKVPGVPFEERNLFLRGDDDRFCQIGYGTADDGTGFVCNTTYMPGVTSEMLDWWFPWHSVGSDLRYKIWDPEDHYFARADNAEYVCDSGVPVNQKTWGVNHYVLEDIGNGPSFLKLQFKSPSDFGYAQSLVDSQKCKSLVSAIGAGECAAAMTHKWYEHDNGVMLCSRFWIGFGVVDGKIVKTLPDGVRIPIDVPRGLFAHNIKEFSNLSKILPEVYVDNKDNF